MTATLTPSSAADVLDLVKTAVAEGTPLAIAGTASKTALGRPVEARAVLDLSGLSGVDTYEAPELYLTAKPGTPWADVKALLDQQGQAFAFEPMDYGPLLGGAPGRGTIGGLVATNLAGPRRVKAGAARDHVLGFKAVSGRGEVFKSGGTVMKNVTGYDLSKVMTGSWGTLGVLTEVTLKVLPKAETEQTLLLHGLDDAAAVAALTSATGSPHEGSSFAHLPADALPDPVRGAGGSVTAIRLEGPEVSVRQRVQDMMAHLGHHTCDTLDEAASTALWAAVRDVLPLAGGDAQVWRLSVAPTAGPGVVAAIRAAGVPVERHLYDWAGGLVWLAVAAADHAHADAVRAAVNAAGGHATLIRAADAVRASVPVFHPQPAPLAALTARLKDSFDPARILNRGRMRHDL